MDDIATSTRNPNALAEALEMINDIPNPYYAFSEYEQTRLIISKASANAFGFRVDVAMSSMFQEYIPFPLFTET
jgi:hypothetical protein